MGEIHKIVNSECPICEGTGEVRANFTNSKGIYNIHKEDCECVKKMIPVDSEVAFLDDRRHMLTNILTLVKSFSLEDENYIQSIDLIEQELVEIAQRRKLLRRGD